MHAHVLLQEETKHRAALEEGKTDSVKGSLSRVAAEEAYNSQQARQRMRHEVRQELLQTERVATRRRIEEEEKNAIALSRKASLDKILQEERHQTRLRMENMQPSDIEDIRLSVR
jgi:hypothetical protein